MTQTSKDRTDEHLFEISKAIRLGDRWDDLAAGEESIAKGKLAAEREMRRKRSAAEPAKGITAFFHREGMFYPVLFSGLKSPCEEAADQAALNPGTLRIEDAEGNLLWAAETH